MGTPTTETVADIQAMEEETRRWNEKYSEWKEKYYRVLHVSAPSTHQNKFLRYIYVDSGDRSLKTIHPGWRIGLDINEDGSATFTPKEGTEPFRTNGGSMVKHIGWVSREDGLVEVIRISSGIPIPTRFCPSQCWLGCHRWTDNVIRELRRAGVLVTLSSDDTSIRTAPLNTDYGPYP